METIRLISYSSKDGTHEGVYFTSDLEANASDFIPPVCTIDIDQQIEMNTFGFPLEYNFTRN